MKKSLVAVIIIISLAILGFSHTLGARNIVQIKYDPGNYVVIPFDLDFGEIKFPNIEMQLINVSNTVVPIEENMVFYYYHESVIITENEEASVDISLKMIFETFYETESFNLSKLGERLHKEIGKLGASPIPIGSLRIYQGDIRVRSTLPGSIKQIKSLSVRYENESKETIQTQIKREGEMFHILLTQNLTHFSINDTAILLDISYVVDKCLIDSFYSYDRKKQGIQIRYVPECYIFDMSLSVYLPDKISLIKADNLQGFGDELFFSQELVAPNDIKTFNIEYLVYLSLLERILNDPWINLIWIVVGIFISFVVLLVSKNRCFYTQEIVFSGSNKNKKPYYCTVNSRCSQ